MFLGSAGALISALVIGSLVISIWGILDAANRPDYAWTAAGQNKVLWIALQAVGLVFTVLGGLVMGIVYLAAIRPKVQASEGAGPNY